MPCFVARDKSTNELIGAFWADTNNSFYLEKRYTKPVYWIRNLFVRSELRGKGVGKRLLGFGVHVLFQDTPCDAILSQIHVDRAMSTRVHTQVGFYVVGEYKESHIGNYWFGTFIRN